MQRHVSQQSACRVNKAHIPCRSERFTCSCARETSQSAVRTSLKSVWWETISDVFVVKGDTTESCFSSQSSKKSSVPASPANRCRSSEKAKSSCMGSLLVIKNPLPSMFVPRLEAVPKSPQLSVSVRGAPSLPATILLF